MHSLFIIIILLRFQSNDAIIWLMGINAIYEAAKPTSTSEG
jgi:hypothetical protein